MQELRKDKYLFFSQGTVPRDEEYEKLKIQLYDVQFSFIMHYNLGVSSTAWPNLAEVHPTPSLGREQDQEIQNKNFLCRNAQAISSLISAHFSLQELSRKGGCEM